MSSGTLDPFFTDRCPQYRTITAVPLANLVIIVKRRESVLKMGPDESMKHAILEAYNLYHDDFRALCAGICSIPRVDSVQIQYADKSGLEFDYLY